MPDFKNCVSHTDEIGTTWLLDTRTGEAYKILGYKKVADFETYKMLVAALMRERGPEKEGAGSC